MGLRDDMNKLESAARSADSAARERADTQTEIVSRLWADFLSYCRDFASLAPRHGIPPKSGTEIVARIRDSSRQGSGYQDHRIQHPGGWVMNQQPRVSPMFYITTGGALFVEGRPRVGTKFLPSRKVTTFTFDPCPALSAAPGTTPSLPWRFKVHTSIPRGECMGAARDVAKEDLERFGGCVALDTPWEESYAKGFILKSLSPAR